MRNELTTNILQRLQTTKNYTKRTFAKTTKILLCCSLSADDCFDITQYQIIGLQ